MYIPSILNEVDRILVDLQRTFLSLHPNETPRVVFDCDQTLIEGDIGEYTLAYMLHHKLSHTDPQWWSYLSSVLDDDSLYLAYQAECKQTTALSDHIFTLILDGFALHFGNTT